ncbi:MAG: DUF3365 domain-containing protein [Bdellovibrionales bacterium]|nr:DUF3365 domain-containing protein [Bdellovibrionales bacterium]
MSLKNRIIFAIVFASTLGIIIQIFASTYELRKQGEKDLIKKSSAILSRLEKARDYVANQGGLESTIERVKKAYPNGDLSKEAKEQVLHQVPIYASLKIGSEDAAKEGYQFRVFSNFPRKKENLATTHEKEILNKFLNNPELAQIEESNSDEVIVYRPVSLSEKDGCLKCHGSPETSPWGNGKDILGYKMENWKDNYLHAAFAITQSKQTVKSDAKSAIFFIIFVGLISLALSLLVGFVVTKKTLDKLRDANSEINSVGQELYSASGEIFSSSQSLSVAATEAAASIEETSASTEEVSSMIKLNANNSDEAKKLA